jgi:hypothetical protein
MPKGGKTVTKAIYSFAKTAWTAEARTFVQSPDRLKQQPSLRYLG